MAIDHQEKIIIGSSNINSLLNQQVILLPQNVNEGWDSKVTILLVL